MQSTRWFFNNSTTQFFAACTQGNLDACETLYAAVPSDIDRCAGLVLAKKNNHVQIAEWIQEKNPNYLNSASQWHEVGKLFSTNFDYSNARYCFKAFINLLDHKDTDSLLQAYIDLVNASTHALSLMNDENSFAGSKLKADLKNLLLLITKECIDSNASLNKVLIFTIKTFSTRKDYAAVIQYCQLIFAKINKEHPLWIPLQVSHMIAQLHSHQEIREDDLNKIVSEAAKTKGDSLWDIMDELSKLGTCFDEKQKYQEAHCCYEAAFNMPGFNDYTEDTDTKELYLKYGYDLIRTQLKTNHPTRETLNKMLAISKTMNAYDDSITSIWNETGHLFFNEKKYDETEKCYQTSFDLFYSTNIDDLDYHHHIFYIQEHTSNTSNLINVKLVQHASIQATLNNLFDDINKMLHKAYLPDEYDLYAWKGCHFYRMDSIPKQLESYKNSFIFCCWDLYHVNAKGELNKVPHYNKNFFNNECKNDTYLSNEAFINNIFYLHQLDIISERLISLAKAISMKLDPDLFELTVQCYLKAYEIALKVKNSRFVQTALKQLSSHYFRSEKPMRSFLDSLRYISYPANMVRPQEQLTEDHLSRHFNILNFSCHDKINSPNTLTLLELEFIKLTFDFIHQSFARFTQHTEIDSPNITAWKIFLNDGDNQWRFDALRKKLHDLFSLRPFMLQEIVARDPHTLVCLTKKIYELEFKVEQLERKCQENGIEIEDEVENTKKRKHDEDVCTATVGMFAAAKKMKTEEASVEMEAENYMGVNFTG